MGHALMENRNGLAVAGGDRVGESNNAKQLRSGTENRLALGKITCRTLRKWKLPSKIRVFQQTASEIEAQLVKQRNITNLLRIGYRSVGEERHR